MEQKIDIPEDFSAGAIWARRLAIVAALAVIIFGGLKVGGLVKVSMTNSRVEALGFVFDSLANSLDQYQTMHDAFMPWRDIGAGPELDIEYWGAYSDTIIDEFLAFDLSDPFSPENGRMVRYWSAEPGAKPGWTIWSTGPDEDYDILYPADYANPDQNTYQELLSLRYDPTNGTHSSGDLFFVYRQAPETSSE